MRMELLRTYEVVLISSKRPAYPKGEKSGPELKTIFMWYMQSGGINDVTCACLNIVQIIQENNNAYVMD